jgi:hypothetical protein
MKEKLLPCSKWHIYYSQTSPCCLVSQRSARKNSNSKILGDSQIKRPVLVGDYTVPLGKLIATRFPFAYTRTIELKKAHINKTELNSLYVLQVGIAGAWMVC